MQRQNPSGSKLISPLSLKMNILMKCINGKDNPARAQQVNKFNIMSAFGKQCKPHIFVYSPKQRFSPCISMAFL